MFYLRNVVITKNKAKIIVAASKLFVILNN